MAFLFMDWETQSDLDLTVTGTLRYVLDPSTRVLLLSWAVGLTDALVAYNTLHR